MNILYDRGIKLYPNYLIFVWRFAPRFQAFRSSPKAPPGWDCDPLSEGQMNMKWDSLGTAAHPHQAGRAERIGGWRDRERI